MLELAQQLVLCDRAFLIEIGDDSLNQLPNLKENNQR